MVQAALHFKFSVGYQLLREISCSSIVQQLFCRWLLGCGVPPSSRSQELVSRIMPEFHYTELTTSSPNFAKFQLLCFKSGLQFTLHDLLSCDQESWSRFHLKWYDWLIVRDDTLHNPFKWHLLTNSHKVSWEMMGKSWMILQMNFMIDIRLNKCQAFLCTIWEGIIDKRLDWCMWAEWTNS